MADFLSYGSQCINDADIEAVVRVLRSDWLTQGPLVERFEKLLAERTGSKYAVACSNGTAALHLAALAAGLGEGQSAIIPAITFVATANAVRMTGAEVIFADVDPTTGRMTADTLASALHDGELDRVRAVLPVHLGGAATAMPEISTVAADHNAIVIEDACHALGGSYERNGEAVPVGACADAQMACFSFHPVKPVTTGEGGAVTTNDAELAARMRRLRSHGITRVASDFQVEERGADAEGKPNPWYYEMQEIGWNYRLSDIQCALGLSQLARLDDFRGQRDSLASRYRELLASIAPIVQATPPTPGVASGHHLFTVLIDFEAAGTTRASLMTSLRERGIGTQVHYIPVPWQPYYTARYRQRPFPGAEAYYARCLSLPLFVGMTMTDVERVVDALKEVLQA